jgi:hypothetical protein
MSTPAIAARKCFNWPFKCQLSPRFGEPWSLVRSINRVGGANDAIATKDHQTHASRFN